MDIVEQDVQKHDLPSIKGNTKHILTKLYKNMLHIHLPDDNEALQAAVQLDISTALTGRKLYTAHDHLNQASEAMASVLPKIIGAKKADLKKELVTSYETLKASASQLLLQKDTLKAAYEALVKKQHSQLQTLLTQEPLSPTIFNVLAEFDKERKELEKSVVTYLRENRNTQNALDELYNRAYASADDKLDLQTPSMIRGLER